MTTAGLIILGLGLVLVVAASVVTFRQVRAAGGDPIQGEFVGAAGGGVSKRTSVVMLLAWLLVIVGAVLLVFSWLL